MEKVQRMPHIGILTTQNARYAILPGDPARVDRIAAHLTDAKMLCFCREYKSYYGFYKKMPVLVMSTGMGGPSTAIAVEELADLGVRYMVRTGSCGAMIPEIKTGDLVLSLAAVKHEGTTKAYEDEAIPAAASYELLKACEEAAKKLDVTYHVGLTRSHDAIYAKNKPEIEKYCKEHGIIASDMETAALYVVGRQRGVLTASILNVVASCAPDMFDEIADYAAGESMSRKGEEREILTALEALLEIYHGEEEKK